MYCTACAHCRLMHQTVLMLVSRKSAACVYLWDAVFSCLSQILHINTHTRQSNVHCSELCTPPPSLKIWETPGGNPRQHGCFIFPFLPLPYVGQYLSRKRIARLTDKTAGKPSKQRDGQAHVCIQYKRHCGNCSLGRPGLRQHWVLYQFEGEFSSRRGVWWILRLCKPPSHVHLSLCVCLRAHRQHKHAHMHAHTHGSTRVAGER